MVLHITLATVLKNQSLLLWNYVVLLSYCKKQGPLRASNLKAANNEPSVEQAVSTA